MTTGANIRPNSDRFGSNAKRHQVYEQQIANLKNDTSLAIQINPIYSNSHLLTLCLGLQQDSFSHILVM